MTTHQPTNNPLNHAPVDVLAVMDAAIEAARSQLKDAQTEGTAAASAFRSSQLDGILQARAAIAELIEAANRAHMALIGYLPAHRNAVTDEAIAKVSAALARVGGAL